MPPNRSRTRRTSSRQTRGSNDILRRMLLASQPESGPYYIHRQRNGPFQPPLHSFPNESVNGSHFSALTTGWSRPPAGSADDVSDQAPGSFSELGSKRGVSFVTPATRTSSSDGDYCGSNGEAVTLRQCSPGAERVLQGIGGTNYDPEYHCVEKTHQQHVPYNSQYGSCGDLQPMDFNYQNSISHPVPPSTNPLEAPWSEWNRTYYGPSYISDTVEEDPVFHQPLNYDCWTHWSCYGEREQRGALQTPSEKAYTDNQQHLQLPFASANRANHGNTGANGSTPDSAASTSSGSPASSTATALHIPGRRNGPLSPSSRHNARIMREKGSCFRCFVMKERCVMDEHSDHDGMCKGCRDRSNDFRTWELHCSRLKLQDRVAFMLPDALTTHLHPSKISEYIQLHTAGPLTGSPFKLALEMDFDTPLELDVVEFVPRGQKDAPMLAFQLTANGSNTDMRLNNPPIIPVLVDKRAIRQHINTWLDSISRETKSDFPEYCFPGAHEHWQREILTILCTYHRAYISRLETNGLGPFQTLRWALKLTTLNHIMCYAFTVPDNKVESLLRKLRRYPPTGPPGWVCPRLVNKVIKYFCLPLLNRAIFLVLKHLHKILRSTTDKELLWDQAFSIVFLCLIVIGKNQVALVERAKVCQANDDNSFSMQDAVKCIEKMELELSEHLIGMFHQRFSTKKGGSGNGKTFNPLAGKPGGERLPPTELMQNVRLATERYSWDKIKSSAELPLSELLDLDNMKQKNVTRLLCTFMRHFAPRDA